MTTDVTIDLRRVDPSYVCQTLRNELVRGGVEAFAADLIERKLVLMVGPEGQAPAATVDPIALILAGDLRELDFEGSLYERLFAALYEASEAGGYVVAWGVRSLANLNTHLGVQTRLNQEPKLASIPIIESAEMIDDVIIACVASDPNALPGEVVFGLLVRFDHEFIPAPDVDRVGELPVGDTPLVDRAEEAPRELPIPTWFGPSDG